MSLLQGTMKYKRPNMGASYHPITMLEQTCSWYSCYEMLINKRDNRYFCGKYWTGNYPDNLSRVYTSFIWDGLMLQPKDNKLYIRQNHIIRVIGCE